MFKVGDWVKITPTPDLRWNQWYNSRDIYQEYLDKIGVIEFVADDDERDGEFLYAVKVSFPNGLGHLTPGDYYEWFRESHLIRSSQAAANTRLNMIEAGKNLQEWEKFKKKTTDDMLRKIFGQEEEKVEKKIDDPNQWDMKVEKKSDEEYDTYYDDGYYPDYNTYTYTNSTDVDDYYYTDMSDAKSKDQD